MEINAAQGVIKVTDFCTAGASQGFSAVVPLGWSGEGSQRCSMCGVARAGHSQPRHLCQRGSDSPASSISAHR